MKPGNRIIFIAALAVCSQSVNAIPFSFEGRSLGMGGVSVATADLASAAWANPAMLSNQRPEDDFSLLIGVGAFLRDNDDLLTDVDDFQAADDARTAAINNGNVAGEAAALLTMSQVVGRIEGKVIAPEATAAVAMGMAFDSFAMAVSARADVIAAGAVTDLSCSIQNDPTCTPTRFESEVTSTDFNILNLEGLVAVEVGVPLARDFQILDRKVLIGIKPKIVDLTSFRYREAILTVSSGLDSINKEDVKQDIGTFSTIDMGAAIDLSDSFRVGLTVRNLLTKDFDVQLGVINGVALIDKLNFDTEARIGVAYHNDAVTVAVDYDITENKVLLANPAFDKLKTQYLAVGAELNAFDFMQLRVGAAKNIAGGISSNARETALTAGIGFWFGFKLDLAAMYTNNSLGGYLQTGFSF